MIRPFALAAVAVGGVGSLVAAYYGPTFEFPTEGALVRRAVELRSQGPHGLQVALTRMDELANAPGADSKVAREQMRRCVDLVAGQRDAWMSRLYWHTDLEEAKAAAAAAGKPILSLRMLGRLTDEFSCANSRFFRTALYANKSVANRLRENFVLHWQSVRPVPKITIDFGDGRTMQRTITGNSAHYVLDVGGRPLDVLPGLYGPKAFEDWLVRCESLASTVASADGEAARDAAIQEYHAARRDAIDAQLHADLAEVNSVPAIVARRWGGATAENLDDDMWQRIAALSRHLVDLDMHSQALIFREFPDANAAGRRASSKIKVENPLLRIVRSFEASAAVDGVKNECQLHRQIHTWFAAGQAPREFDALNERVYAEVFLTPSSDPWLGLAPADAYTGLVGGGLSTVAGASLE